jgi:hypothetical protein
MSRRSAVSKLQALLIIDLIIVASAAAAFFYVDALPGAPLSDEQIQLVDLQIAPNNALVGQSVVVSVNATNKAGEEGTYSAELFLDGVLSQTSVVSFSAGDSKIVEFTISQASEGLHIVKIGTLEGSFSVLNMFELSDLAVNRTEAGVGEPIGISVKIANRANESSAYTLTLLINDDAVQTKTGQLEVGAVTSILFEVVEQIEGTYQFRISNLNGTFEVVSTALPPKPAEFQVTNLVIDPEIVEQGAPVDITAKVTNIGELSGAHSVSLTINGAVKETKSVQLSGGETATVQFTVTQSSRGTYNVEVGGLTGTLNVQGTSTIQLIGLIVRPYEVWAGDTVTVIVKGNNTGEASSLSLKLKLNGETVQTKTFTLATGEVGSTEFTFEAPSLPGGDSLMQSVNVNSLSGGIMVVKTGFHTLSVAISPYGNADFNLTLPSGQIEKHKTFWSALLPEGTYTVTMPATDPEGLATWIAWEDESTSLTRTVNLTTRTSITANYNPGSSCPSVYFWNGTSYVYVADISNDGWLGYTGYMTENGSIVYVGGNPWDHAKLDNEQLQLTEIGNNSYYSVKLTQNWNELFYLDAAYMVVVDHPSDSDVYATLMNYLNPAFNDQIYTVSKTDVTTPISAVNEKGQDVLSKLDTLDGVFTPGNNGIVSPTWDNINWNHLTLDLGDLSNASEIKLIINGMVDWGLANDYYDWIAKFDAAAAKGLVPNGTQIAPAPYIEVQNSAGQWVRAPENVQVPLPADYVARTYIVDLTGIFPADVSQYKIRISNFWNVTFDYIGIDTSQQEPISTQRIDPSSANLTQVFSSPSVSSGNFTRYGDVTELMLNADDMFVIGRQGDSVSLLFPADGLMPPAEGMERDYFMFVACWFKDPPNNWGYGFDFTVEPLPFRAMSGFPYPPTESYPQDDAHLNYLREWNTRVIEAPSPQPQAFLSPLMMWVAAITALITVTNVGVLVYFKKRIR